MENTTAATVIENECSEENFEEIFRWLVQNQRTDFHWELWKLVKSCPDARFILAKDEEHGTVLGCLVYLKVEKPKLNHISTYIVRPDLRGRGIGKFLWNEMLKETSGETLKILSVEPMTTKYKQQSGFTYTDKSILFCQLQIQVLENALMEKLQTFTVPQSETQQICTIETLNKDELLSNGDTTNLLLDYDKKVCGINRRVSMLSLLSTEISNCSLAYRQGPEGKLETLGYGNIMQTLDGVRVGPLYGDNLHTALKILEYLMKNFAKDNKHVWIYVPEENKEFHEFVFGLVKSDGFWMAMNTSYTAPVTNGVDWSKVYSVTMLATQTDC